LDGVFTNIKAQALNMVPVEGLNNVTDHKLLTFRLKLNGRDLNMEVKKAT
jgi:hypothetical protein